MFDSFECFTQSIAISKLLSFPFAFFIHMTKSFNFELIIKLFLCVHVYLVAYFFIARKLCTLTFLFIKGNNARCGLLPFMLFVRSVLKELQTIQSSATPLGCPPELNDKILLWRHHTLYPCYMRKIKLPLTRSCLLCG